MISVSVFRVSVYVSRWYLLYRPNVCREVGLTRVGPC